MALIDVHGLTKSYGGRRVLAPFDLTVEPGEMVGILGPNGAGKTTAVECIGGLRTRDGGTVSVAGMDPATDASGLRLVLGMQLQQARLPAKMTTREAIDVFGAFYPDPVPTDELLQRFGLEGQARTRFASLSGGQQQRLSVALALVGRPRIAFLDELTTGLDPASRRAIWDYLLGLRDDGLTMLLVTHSMEEAAHLCDQLVIVDAGRIVAQGTPDEITGDARTQTSFEAGPGLDLGVLRAVPGVGAVTIDRGRVVVTGGPDSPHVVLGVLASHGVVVQQLRVTAPTLDEAYLRLTAPQPSAPGKDL